MKTKGKFRISVYEVVEQGTRYRKRWEADKKERQYLIQQQVNVTGRLRRKHTRFL